ncbi:unnamed protein product [Chironomus riparius]|uniref:Uncharacterized protein n=1 Tax=Chironomus riparius TaxID=315576 RepID=A0A9N9RMW6_9DIPT|nr:unnamed protein product [Chironomus riparius]
MTSQADNAPNTEPIRRKSSILAALTLNCNLPTIPIINEPCGLTTSAVPSILNPASVTDVKKKSLRFDTNTFTSEYETEEIKETKRRITDEIKSVPSDLNGYQLNASYSPSMHHSIKNCNLKDYYAIKQREIECQVSCQINHSWSAPD